MKRLRESIDNGESGGGKRPDAGLRTPVRNEKPGIAAGLIASIFQDGKEEKLVDDESRCRFTK